MSLQQDQLYEGEAHLQNQHEEFLPDLNEEPAYEQEDEIAHLQEDQLYEDEAHLQGQPLRPYIFVKMNALVCMSSISMLMLSRENKNITKENKEQVLNMLLVIALSFVKLFITIV
jgi:hypothetical protein